MKLTKNEQDILAIERFFNTLRKDFRLIEFISVYLPCIENTISHYNPKKNHFPLKIRIYQDGSSREYEWKPGISDDEYPLYDIHGESYGFHEMRNYIQENLPEAFKGRRIYKEERYFATNNIEPMLEALKQKVLASKLMEELPLHNKHSKPKVKI